MKQLRIAAMVAAIVGGMASNNATAAEPGAFLGAEFGGSYFEVDDGSAGSASDSDQATVVRGGYYFTPNIAVEVFHANLYDWSGSGTSMEVEGFGAGLVGRKNFGADGNGYYLLGRAGAFQAEGRASTPFLAGVDDEATVPYFGVGGGFDFNRNVGIGLHVTHYQGDFQGVDIDSTTFTAAVEYRF